MASPSPHGAENYPPISASVDPNFDSVRAILLAPEWARLRVVEEENARLRRESQAQIEAMRAQIVYLQDELHRLRQEVEAESAALETRLLPKMSQLIAQTIGNARDEMAEILGPVIGEAIRVQIRDSRQIMVGALSPIILETVQRALSAFARELQRNIDARLRQTFELGSVRRLIVARLRGVSPSELALRDAFPYAIQEFFLIQHESGLLLAHQSMSEENKTDSDLVSGMLTAIRDFVSDSFGNGNSQESLWEVEFGDGERIIIQSGQYAYLAVVIRGIEPEGFRSQLQQFIGELHVHHQQKLRDYKGDPETLPDLIPLLQKMLVQRSSQTIDALKTIDAPKAMSRQQKLVLAGASLASIFFVSIACLYLQFTIALWPLAFGASTPMPVPSPVSEISIPAPTATSTPTLTPTLSPTLTPTSTPAPSPTRAPLTGIQEISSPTWARSLPSADASLGAPLWAGTTVTVVSQLDEWVEVTWETVVGQQRGWIPIAKITLSAPIPVESITPVP
jgi:hypothetical protein